MVLDTLILRSFAGFYLRSIVVGENVDRIVICQPRVEFNPSVLSHNLSWRLSLLRYGRRNQGPTCMHCSHSRIPKAFRELHLRYSSGTSSMAGHRTFRPHSKPHGG